MGPNNNMNMVKHANWLQEIYKDQQVTKNITRVAVDILYMEYQRVYLCL